MVFDGEERRSDMLEMKDQIREIYNILTGNGNPENGLAFRIKSIEMFMNVIIRCLWIGAVPVIGSMVVMVLNIVNDYAKR